MKIEDLRRLCAEFWNPIGVPMANLTTAEKLGFPPLPEDEYDVYLLHALSMAEAGAAKNQVVGYLEIVERDYLVLSRAAGDKSRFVDALFGELNKVK